MQTRQYKAAKVRRYSLFFSLGIFVLLFIYCAAVLTWPLRPIAPTPVSHASTIKSEVSAVWPTAYSAIGDTEHGLLASSSHEQVPIASITKLVTALVILDAKPLKQGETGPAVTLTSNDVALYNKYVALDGTVGAATSGMQLSEYQLLQGMLLSSANNYADTAAIWAFGSVEAYISAANAYLAKHGYANTAVVDATGFSPASKSTAADLVKLGVQAIDQPVIAGIVSQKSAIIPGAGTFVNTNKLLGTEGIIGLKTGTTEEAGSCLLFASQFTKEGKNITAVGVVLGASNHSTLFQSVATLTEQTISQYTVREITKNGTAYATYTTPWGVSTTAVSSKTTDVSWQGADINITTRPVKITPDKNQTAGVLAATVGNKKHTSALKTAQPLTGPSWMWRITHPGYIFNF